MPQIKGMCDIAINARFGELCIIWSFVKILPGVIIGDRCVIGSSVYIGKNTRIGNDVHIQDGCHITDHMIIGDGVFIGPHVVMTNDRHPVVNNPDYNLEAPVIEDDASLGANCTVLPGVRIGCGAIIGAGSTVTKDVPAGMIYYNKVTPIMKPRFGHEAFKIHFSQADKSGGFQ